MRTQNRVPINFGMSPEQQNYARYIYELVLLLVNGPFGAVAFCCLACCIIGDSKLTFRIQSTYFNEMLF